MKKLLLVLSTVLVMLSAKASADRLPDPASMRKNIHYLLTEKRARSLNIDLSKLKRDLSVKETELVTVLLDENEQLNLAIFDEEVFVGMAMDIIK